MDATATSQQFESRRLRFGGRVQGVGFRPFLYRLAAQCGLGGSACNVGGTVEVVAQGTTAQLAEFLARLFVEAPPLATPRLLSNEPVLSSEFAPFTILPSQPGDNSAITLPVDLPPCDGCVNELHDRRGRRHHYPFTTCTQCGPRYTIMQRLPYERTNTAMDAFPLCAACAAEYGDNRERRYHAETLACPQCGPQLLWQQGAMQLTASNAAIAAAVTALRNGEIVALKGVGGYHLLCDARNEAAVARLRQRKQRPTKPLAVMFPWQASDGLEAVRDEVVVEACAAARLTRSERPIVLCRPQPGNSLAPSIAPGLGEIGVMLPYSPLHLLLLDEFSGPLVATSGNVSGEPVICDNAEATARLAAVADGFLHHNRPILRPVDDSLYRTMGNTTRPLRLGRGSAPLHLELPMTLPRPVLAVGGHLKNTVALAWDKRIVLSPHIGDLDTPRGMALFRQHITELQQLYGISAATVVCDAHPDYNSSRWAQQCGLPLHTVLHHHAHASALYGEHHGTDEWLVFTWDGSGYGGDGTLWGGESFIGSPAHWQRFSSLLPFHLPGGDAAARQPWRTALALCWESGETWPEVGFDTTLLHHAWQRHLNAPRSSAVGRLFDGAAALLGLCRESHYEGEAPARLEAIATRLEQRGALPLVKSDQPPWLIDWQPLLPLLLDESLTVAERAGQFHRLLACSIVAVALRARENHGIATVGLCGGVFQNRLLTELAQQRLEEHGFRVKLPQQIPGNDGGLAIGQVIDYLYRREQTIP